MVGQRVMVVVSGNAHHGKDSLADLLATMIPQSRRDSFAYPLKQCVSLMTGIPMDILMGPASLKNDARFGRYGMSPRQLMQDVGQWARDHISVTVWRDRAADRCLNAAQRVTIISDGRHPDEEILGIGGHLAGAGKENMTFGVRIVRPDMPLQLGHPSEDKVAAVSDEIFDFKVINHAPKEVDPTHPEFEDHFTALTAQAQQLADALILRAKGVSKRKLAGWIVRCPDGSQRRPEPQATKEGAQMLARQLMAPCELCGAQEDHSIEPCAFDQIIII